ncbi:prepilin peptidase [Candidatus Microgenomates bacterium]|nr:prepilin peptidase [Candidatus Microgenomates bacterium]
MTILTGIFLFVLGLCIGSFLNVLIDRLPKGKSVVSGRSHCDYCRHTLAWYDLIPLFSFLYLRRKCRYCQKVISWQYPVIELLTGAFFVLVYLLDNQNYQLLITNYQLIIISGLIVIFFADLKFRIIPDQVLIVLIAASFLFDLFYEQNLLLGHLLAAIVFGAFFLILFLFTKGKGMGFGDVKFAFFMGLFLGYPKIIVAFYLSFLTGAAVSLILILAGKKTMKSTIPFGPFLIVSTIISQFMGNQLWEIFKRFLTL